MPNIPAKIPQAPSAIKASALNRQGYPREQTGTREGNATQENARKALAPLQGSPFLNGKLLTNVSFVSGVVKVLQHELGRVFQGYWVMNHSLPGAGTMTQYVTLDKNPAINAAQIALTPQGTFTADVWVY